MAFIALGVLGLLYALTLFADVIAYAPKGEMAARAPLILEVIDSLTPLMRGHVDRAMDVVNIKISKFGGLTKARQARDLCAALGQPTGKVKPHYAPSYYHCPGHSSHVIRLSC